MPAHYDTVVPVAEPDMGVALLHELS